VSAPTGAEKERSMHTITLRYARYLIATLTSVGFAVISDGLSAN
jgi:hypothetical protein